VHKFRKAKSWPAIGSDEWNAANYSLALYDTLGLYVDKGYVPKSVVLDSWSYPLNAIAPAALAFMEYRNQETERTTPWRGLESLLLLTAANKDLGDAAAVDNRTGEAT
ncbi:MAG: hypothetical protein ACRCYU_20060, partial [Nocardioides sp.]